MTPTIKRQDVVRIAEATLDMVRSELIAVKAKMNAQRVYLDTLEKQAGRMSALESQAEGSLYYLRELRE